MLAYSRGSLLAAAVGLAFWLILVPLRLRSATVLIAGVGFGALLGVWAFGLIRDSTLVLLDAESDPALAREIAQFVAGGSDADALRPTLDWIRRYDFEGAWMLLSAAAFGLFVILSLVLF